MIVIWLIVGYLVVVWLLGGALHVYLALKTKLRGPACTPREWWDKN